MNSFVFGSHNLTEGIPTTADAESDVLVCQEVDRRRTRRGLDGHRFFFPARDRHQCIAWNPDVFKRDGHGTAFRLHRSGRAEGWPFKSPARYVLRQWLVHRETGLLLTVFGVWLLNSWDPVRRDEDTAQRMQIGTASLEVIARKVAVERHDGRIPLVGGDFNSQRARIGFGGLHNAGPARGLDRLFYTPGPLVLGRTWEGPPTGVGRDMQHHSRHAEFTIATPKGKP